MSDTQFTMLLIGGSFLLVGMIIIWLSIAESNDWQKFAAEHDCKLIATEQGSTVPIFNNDGKGGVGFAYVSGKQSFKCNDGVVYTR